ncbi:glycosyltransferase family 2 protein [Rhodovastum atsumiense]|uniref:glycosyltransferase family 2 protein n=1 Tax=Rhodovastum atsumiense TaxID=504468 RepID=UPI00139F2B82|nr:glycosyltransferase family 2 protein [Rhodovastum atsumiense]
MVILALDRAQDTVAAITSALAQIGVTRHVIVVDQGSRPANLALLAAAVEGRSDATLVQLDRNHGVAGGRNRGTGLGHGRVVVALDNDAEFDEVHTLARAVAALDADPGLAAVGFRIVRFADGADDLLSWGYPRSLLPRAAETFEAATFVGAGHAIRRRSWEEAGGYDDALFFCWEEFDFCLRAIEHGWRVRYRGDIVVRHKVSGEQRFAWSGTRWFHFVRNRLYIERKWGASQLALLPRFCGYLLRGVRNGVGWQTLRAWPAAMRLGGRAERRVLSTAARSYLDQHDMAHRGTLLARLRREVLAALPGRG